MPDPSLGEKGRWAFYFAAASAIAAAALCGEDKSPYAVIWLGRRREENHD